MSLLSLFSWTLPLPVMATCACLLCSDIAKLWEVAGRRYGADPAEAHSVTQGRRIWDEMPQTPGEVRAGWGALPDCLIAPQLLYANRAPAVAAAPKMAQCCVVQGKKLGHSICLAAMPCLLSFLFHGTWPAGRSAMMF